MKIIGITGSIAMGKSFVIDILQKQNVKILNSDNVIAEIISENTDKISALFPEALKNSCIDKSVLRDIFFNDKKRKKLLEQFLYPIFDKKIHKFIQNARYRKIKTIAIEIVLLFEKRYEYLFNEIWNCSCNKIIQEKRLFRRSADIFKKNIFKNIIKNQMPDHKKRILADKLIYTGACKTDIRRQVIMINDSLM